MSREIGFRWHGHHHQATAEFRGGRLVLELGGRRIVADYAREGSTVVLRDAAGVESRVATARDARGLWLSLEGRTWLLVPESRHAGNAHHKLREIEEQEFITKRQAH